MYRATWSVVGSIQSGHLWWDSLGTWPSSIVKDPAARSPLTQERIHHWDTSSEGIIEAAIGYKKNRSVTMVNLRG